MDLVLFVIGAIFFIVFAVRIIYILVELEISFPVLFIGIVIVSLALVAYHGNIFTDKFKAGDCIQRIDLDSERWEKPANNVFEKILEVGKEKYRTVVIMDGIVDLPKYKDVLITSSRYISLTDPYYEKAECSTILKEYSL